LEIEAVPITDEIAEASQAVRISQFSSSSSSSSTTLASAGIGDNDYDNYGYSDLSSGQKSMYDDFEAAFKAYVQSDEYKTLDYTPSSKYYKTMQINNDKGATESIGIYLAFALDKKFSDYGITGSQAMQVYWNFKNNNPEYFWISALTITYTDGGDYQYDVVIDTYYAESADRRMAAEKAIVDGVNAYKTIADTFDSTYDKVKFVHDQIIDDVNYAYVTQGNIESDPSEDIWAHSVAGTFVKRPNAEGKYEIVCEGYAKTFQLILQVIGIENIYVTGTGGGGLHAWNAVKLEDKAYHWFDLTWDDTYYSSLATDSSLAPDGIEYDYFASPKSYFENSHVAGTTNGDPANGGWLYALPTMSDDFSYTFYSKYGMYYSGLADANAASTELKKTAAKTIPRNSRVFHILCATSDDDSYTKSGYDSSFKPSSVKVSNYGQGVSIVFADMGTLGISGLSSGLSLDKETAEVECATKSLELTAKLTPDSSNEPVKWSAEGPGNVVFSEVAAVSTTMCFTVAGKYTITACNLAGSSAECKVTVSASSGSGGSIATGTSSKVYTDSTKSSLVASDDAVLYAAGANVKDKSTGTVTYNKFKNFYTDITTNKYTNAKGKKVKSKVIVAVTTSSTQPTLNKNKVAKDAAANKIASATRKANGNLKVLAKNNAGTVYVWIMEVFSGEVKDVGYLKLNVLQAPTKLQILNKANGSADAAVYKKDNVTLGASVDIYLNPTVAKTKEFVSTADYTVIPAKGMEDYVEVSAIENSKYGYRIKAKVLKNNKRTNVKLIAKCVQNNKKANFTISIFNYATGLPTVSADASVVELNASGEGISGDAAVGDYMSFPVKTSSDAVINATIKLTAATSSDAYTMTDKPKVYKMNSATGFTINAKGNIKITDKATGLGTKIATKIKTSGNDSELTLKVPKAVATKGATTYILVVYNTYNVKSSGMNYGYFVIPVTVETK
nr:hypothetical protein [Lachnospiraceae bacterium]